MQKVLKVMKCNEVDCNETYYIDLKALPLYCPFCQSVETEETGEVLKVITSK